MCEFSDHCPLLHSYIKASDFQGLICFIFRVCVVVILSKYGLFCDVISLFNPNGQVVIGVLNSQLRARGSLIHSGRAMCFKVLDTPVVLSNKMRQTLRRCPSLRKTRANNACHSDTKSKKSEEK